MTRAPTYGDKAALRAQLGAGGFREFNSGDPAGSAEARSGQSTPGLQSHGLWVSGRRSRQVLWVVDRVAHNPQAHPDRAPGTPIPAPVLFALAFSICRLAMRSIVARSTERLPIRWRPKLPYVWRW